MLANVDAKGGRGPAADGLYEVKGDAILGKSGCPAAPHRLASDVRRKMCAQTRDEPGTNRNRTVAAEPELGVNGEKTITGGEVGAENPGRVERGTEVTEDDTIALKQGISLMGRDEKRDIAAREEGNGSAEGEFPISAQRRVVRPSELAEAHEHVKTSEKEGKEEEIVMGTGVGIEIVHQSEVRTRKRAFASGASGETLGTSAEGANYEMVGTMVTNVRVERFQLRTYTRKIGLNRRRFEKMRNVDDIKGESIRGGVNRKIVGRTEMEVRTEGRGVG